MIQQERDSAFIREFIDNGGNATQAAKQVGVSASSASTIGHRLKMRLLTDIEEEQKNSLKGYAVTALHHLRHLVENATSEAVRLGAIKDVLDRAGFKPVDRQQVEQINSIGYVSDEELKAELDSLLKDKYGLTQETMERFVKKQQH